MSHPGGEDPVKKLIDGWTCLCVKNTPVRDRRGHPTYSGYELSHKPLLFSHGSFLQNHFQPFKNVRRRDQDGLQAILDIGGAINDLGLPQMEKVLQNKGMYQREMAMFR